MSSFIGWLDYSEADQRQVRDLLRMFTDKDTVDDLGIGTIRDAISNQLFPGTSVVQTRARYFLFVPWVHQEAERRFPNKVLAKAQDMERKLIEALRQSDDLDGLIGRQAGADVSILPSTIYWNGLATFGIFTVPGLSRSQYGRLAAHGAGPTVAEGELTERARSFWHVEMPPPPADFFRFDYADFALTFDEASWLCERMLSTEHTMPNLLARYVTALRAGAPVPDGAFWNDPLPDGTPPELHRLAHHAHRFSVAARGAAFLYNLMLAELRGREDDAELIDSMRAALADWAIEAEMTQLRGWAADPPAFWQAVLGPGVRVPPATRSFVEEWMAVLTTTSLGSIVHDQRARGVVKARELGHKRAQARFDNPKRLAAWNGESGTAPLSYRWFLVRRFLVDLRVGLDRVAEEGSHALD